MRAEEARALLKKWQTQDRLEDAALSASSKRALSEAIERILGAFALPQADDALAVEALSDLAFTARLTPLFRDALSPLQAVNYYGAKSETNFDLIKIKAQGCERAARCQGASAEAIDGLWELAMWEELANGVSVSKWQWLAELARVNANEGLSIRLSRSVAELRLGELFSGDCPEFWQAGSWWGWVKESASVALDVAKTFETREGSPGGLGWAGDRDVELAQAALALTRLGAEWTKAASPNLRVDKGLVGPAGARGDERQIPEEIPEEIQELCEHALPSGLEWVARAREASLAAPQKNKASNVKSRRL